MNSEEAMALIWRLSREDLLAQVPVMDTEPQ